MSATEPLCLINLLNSIKFKKKQVLIAHFYLFNDLAAVKTTEILPKILQLE
jgi:hypothetical protein